jgi:hypothetical protein
MNNFTGLINTVVTNLQRNSLCHAYHIQETAVFSPEQFAFKIIAELATGGTLQIRIYRNSMHTDYSYHFIQMDTSMRWDNKEHFPSIATFPHHFHDNSGLVEASPLTGDPDHDLPIVLTFLADIRKNIV